MKADRSINDPCCKQMRMVLASNEYGLIAVPRLREYGVSILDGGSSYLGIGYCPWCGQKLPTSLREAWLKELARLGLEPGDKKIPAALLSEDWYKNSARILKRNNSRKASFRKSKNQRGRQRTTLKR